MMPTTFKRDTLKGRIVRRTLAERCVKDAVGSIEPGCELYGLTKGDWSLIDLIEYVLSVSGPADLVCSTWTAAAADMGFAYSLMRNGSIKSMRFVVDFSFPSRQPAYCAALRERFGDDAIRVTKTHAKFVLIRNEKWNLVIRTSMNLNENRRLESWEISDCKEMADFLLETVDALFDEQTAKEAFGCRPGAHMEAFEAQWEDDATLSGEDAVQRKERAKQSTDAKKLMGDGPMDNDLRRSGLLFM